MKYFLQIFGCQSNKSDGERMAGDYEARGYEEAVSWHDCDDLVVVTCAVRQSAEDRVVGFLLNVVSYYKKTNKKRPKIILTGCMTHHGESKIRELLPMVDEVLPVTEVGFNSQAIRKDKKHAWVPISQGCNSFCTYCIVPYSRGREISRSLTDIINEIKKLASQGYEEVTLLGQNVNSWGLEKVGIGLRKLLMDKSKLKFEDIPSNQSQYYSASGAPPFVDLLRHITSIPGIKLVRFMTSNPWDFHDSLIDEISTNEKIDKFIHLPIQSGSNSVLKRMNRGYTKEDYLAVVSKLRSKINNLSLGTDLIVGFPGETEEEFEETVELAKNIGWKVGFIARYSPRPGTAAWRLFKDDVNDQEKKRRWQILEDIINQPNLGSLRPKVVK